MDPLVVTVDQGSSSTKVQVVDQTGTVRGRASVPVGEAHPAPSWVEQDPVEIWASVRKAVRVALSGFDPRAVAAVGISNQRESIVLWERETGRPVAPLVSWQDQRTLELHRTVAAAGVAADVRRLSGLPLDPMFSALKARWLLDRHDPDRVRAKGGQLCLGTVDSWLLSRFGGEHVIEIGNASRTQLLDLDTGTWSTHLLQLFDIPAAAMPRVVASDGPFPAVHGLDPVPDGVPVGGVLGDSHAALFGHGVRGPGLLKATYGTGSSIMTLLEEEPSTRRADEAGMCSTIAWQIGKDSVPRRALEGNIRASGATLTWLARLLGSTPHQIAALAVTGPSDGVHLVPGFNGLGAPWWDSSACGLLSGLTLATGPVQLARAALESVAFQVSDVVHAAERAGGRVTELLADGGASANDHLMQLQADLAGRPVQRSDVHDMSGLGAAHLAGLTVGVWDEAALVERRERRRRFQPALNSGDRVRQVAAWHAAVDLARGRPAGADAS